MYKEMLDEEVNSEETLREFIKNSVKHFYGVDITDETIDSWSEEYLAEQVDFLNYLWEK